MWSKFNEITQKVQTQIDGFIEDPNVASISHSSSMDILNVSNEYMCGYI